MDKEKQIEEMAKDIALIIPANVDLSPRQYLSREFSEKYNGMGIDIKLDAIVNKLFAKGYRKSSEVVGEVVNNALSKIQIMISSIKAQEENGIVTEFNGGAKTALETVFRDIAELKKKYTEE